MGSITSKLAAASAVLYFIFPMSIALFILIFTPLLFISDVNAIRSSGFSGPDSSAALIAATGLIIGISMLIPAFRRMYRRLPWLYSFVKIFFVNLILLNIGLSILNFGYEIDNAFRHISFYILMLVFLIIGRALMCIYFRKKPMTSEEMR